MSGDQGFLEKMVSEAQVSKTAFGHLNQKKMTKCLSSTFTNAARWHNPQFVS